jgi:hypothetical protein
LFDMADTVMRSDDAGHYRSFEKLMLNILVALLNVDPDHFSSKTGTTFRSI